MPLRPSPMGIYISVNSFEEQRGSHHGEVSKLTLPRDIFGLRVYSDIDTEGKARSSSLGPIFLGFA